MSHLIKTGALLLLVVFLGACHSNDQSSTSAENTTENEKNSPPLDDVDVSLSQDGETISSKSVLYCLPSNNCSEETAKRELRNVELNKMTENASVSPVKEGEEITIHIDGPQPEKISFITETQRNDGFYISDEVVDGRSFVIGGKGKYTILLTVQWENENGEFEGRVSQAAKLDVE
ncbi:hypothetical protein GLW03_02960 [Halobacillus halophilus]|uniref:hypothetical protein n=1 Tax=Halobacillus halophilus TaxID=1570 RepID=UPI00137221E2|nr:hypothetical protein [Halobacillus halophilus]MYL28773.1 hypothetical protein [Halobacillus halophilus]